jgi:hypothetical protein
MTQSPRVDFLPPAKVPDSRISLRLEQALGLMVSRGLSIREAAETTGYAPNSLAVALRRPHVQARYRDLRTLTLENGRDLAIRALLDLLVNSKSEDIRLRAARAVAELAERLEGRSFDISGGTVTINLVEYRGVDGAVLKAPG